LFLDYEHRAREDYNYVGLHGIGGYYFDRFDTLLSYSQPLSSVKRVNGRKLMGVNELHGEPDFGLLTQTEVVNAPSEFVRSSTPP
jgi:hypothetical protein